MMEWDVLQEDFQTLAFEDYFTILIIYDIISNKRRTQLAKLLNGFGYRIQKSAFECVLSKEKASKLKLLIEDFAKEEDQIRIYQLNQYVRSTIYGIAPNTQNEHYYFF